MINTFQINKLSDLHNGENIFFCKRDYILNEFDKLSKLSNEVVLITGNSDYIINDEIASKIPINVKFLFAPNNLSKSNKVISIPLGLDNCSNSLLGDYHGIGYGSNCQEYNLNLFVKENPIDKEPKNFIYCNFNVSTNFHHRNEIKKICKNLNHIYVEESNLSTIDFYKKILSFKLILCPSGNGPDTHRFYETLYLKRIPVVFNEKMYENLYRNFPCIFIENIHDLSNISFLNEEILKIKNKKWDYNMLNVEYWKNKILSSL